VRPPWQLPLACISTAMVGLCVSGYLLLKVMFAESTLFKGKPKK
jgi:hypothetical protein